MRSNRRSASSQGTVPVGFDAARLRDDYVPTGFKGYRGRPVGLPSRARSPRTTSGKSSTSISAPVATAQARSSSRRRLSACGKRKRVMTHVHVEHAWLRQRAKRWTPICQADRLEGGSEQRPTSWRSVRPSPVISRGATRGCLRHRRRRQPLRALVPAISISRETRQITSSSYWDSSISTTAGSSWKTATESNTSTATNQR